MNRVEGKKAVQGVLVQDSGSIYRKVTIMNADGKNRQEQTRKANDRDSEWNCWRAVIESAKPSREICQDGGADDPRQGSR